MFFYIDVLLKDKQLNTKTTKQQTLSGRQYLIYAWIRYSLPDSCIYVFLYPETLSRVTLASLGIGFQPKLPTTNNQQPTTDNLSLFIFIY